MLTAALALLKPRRTAPLYHYTGDSLGKFSTREFTEVNITPLKSQCQGAASGSTGSHSEHLSTRNIYIYFSNEDLRLLVITIRLPILAEFIARPKIDIA
jgi:hypothetical protein